jgi:hypothetical protein
VFFDPTKDTPTALDEDQVKLDTLRAMSDAGIDAKLMYAYEKTGRLLTRKNKKYLSQVEIKEWEEAINEYRKGKE